MEALSPGSAVLADRAGHRYLEDGGEVEADEVLFATGRLPLTGDIGLETVGLEPESWLGIDDSCRVRALDGGWLYALGDVNRHALLTHQGKYQARIARAAIAARAAGEPVDMNTVSDPRREIAGDRARLAAPGRVRPVS